MTPTRFAPVISQKHPIAGCKPRTIPIQPRSSKSWMLGADLTEVCFCTQERLVCTVNYLKSRRRNSNASQNATAYIKTVNPRSRLVTMATSATTQMATTFFESIKVCWRETNSSHHLDQPHSFSSPPRKKHVVKLHLCFQQSPTVHYQINILAIKHRQLLIDSHAYQPRSWQKTHTHI